MRAHYWRCGDCYWTGVEKEMLRAPHPFDQTQQIDGCPECKAVDNFEMLCDVTGCKEIASCGWPSTADGYRHTCHKHTQHGLPPAQKPSAPVTDEPMRP